MWIGILLGVASVGGIAYALVLPYFSGELKAESRQQAVAQAKGFVIADHALSLYAHCTQSPCPHRQR